MLNATCLHNSRWRKKKVTYKIIPPSYFVDSIPTVIAKTSRTDTVNTSSKKTASKKQPSEVPKITLNHQKKRASGLSLSSIKAKKEHQIKLANQVHVEKEKPEHKFTEQQLQAVWNTYVEKLERNKEFNLASILSIDIPTLNGTDTVIHLTFPNATNKVELERNQYDLLAFLKAELKNYKITFAIDINDVLEKKYAYTPIEKYEKLKEKNPDIELLKQTFGLDI